jgi:hypothetical protein
MREHDHRPLEWRRVTPGLDADIEHAPTQDDRAGALIGLGQDLGVRVSLAFEHPSVKASVIIAQRIAHAGIGTSDEAIERHRDVAMRLTHLTSYSSLGPWAGFSPEHVATAKGSPKDESPSVWREDFLAVV